MQFIKTCYTLAVTKLEKYSALHQEWKGLVGQSEVAVSESPAGASSDLPWETRLSTLVALIKTHLDYVSWVGAYLQLREGDESLWVTSYQGPVACVQIPPGRGVCGQAFTRREVLIVPNVHEFADHIACDSKSQSEIVLPIWRNGRVVGVLDLDSHSLAAFDEVDQAELKALLKDLEM